MSDEQSRWENKTGNYGSVDVSRPDYFTLQIAADNSCAINFFANEECIGRFYLPADMADLIAHNLDPNVRAANLAKARAGHGETSH